MDKRPLFSICIPTYNRADFLDFTVRKLLSLPAFDNDVEIAISDNASTDATEDIVKRIMADFPDKRVLYNKNTENIKDLNFYKVLTIATGQYRKLQNDTIYFDENDLIHIKSVIACHPFKERYGLFFFMNMSQRFKKGRESLDITNIRDFVTAVHNKITWISNFGCYAEQLPSIENLCTKSRMQLLQMQWTLAIVDASRKSEIYSIDTYKETVFEHKSKNIEPYHFFRPHVLFYYKIIEGYAQKGKIDRLCIFKDKDVLLKDFVGKRFMKLVLLNHNSSFDTSDAWRIMYKHFWMIPRFYYIIGPKFIFKWIQLKVTGKTR